jgi:hypothetical protein
VVENQRAKRVARKVAALRTDADNPLEDDPHIKPVTGRGPLNPTLYGQLKRLFGKVEFSSKGEKAILGVPRFDSRAGGYAENLLHAGEYYRASCPFCSDTRQRLYVNYRWNTPDAVNGRPLRHLATCFNDDCLKQHYQDFEELIYTAQFWSMAAQIKSLPTTHDSRPDALIFATPPGIIIPLTDLPVTHKAVQYVTGRGFDPALLSRNYGVGLCHRAALYPAMDGRLYIPIFMNGKLAGWQGRWVGDDWKAWDAPKFYNLLGFKKSRVLYGYDRAKDARCVVVVEGVSDAWAVGDGAVALLGKTVSQTQRDLLKHWADREGLLALMLDPEAWTTEQKDPEAAQAKHDALLQDLRGLFQGRVVEVPLPAGSDPGSLSRKVNRRIIRTAVKDAGFKPATFGL